MPFKAKGLLGCCDATGESHITSFCREKVWALLFGVLMLNAPVGQCRVCSALGDSLGVAAAPPSPELDDLAHDLVTSLSTRAPPAILVLGCRDLKDTSDKQIYLSILSLPCF